MSDRMATRIDVREYPEFAAGHIAGSKHIPLNQMGAASQSWGADQPLLLICKSGRRAEQARQRLASLGFTHLAVLEGGIDHWIATGNPVQSLQRRPWSMERQVRAVAGSLILITLALSFFVSHLFLIATAFVGAGLVFAGVSDTCMMASVLALLPWNRAA